MGSESRCRILAEKIKAILASGFLLSDDAAHYIDSTFSSPTPESLYSMIEDDAGSEIEPLYELLFFPDVSIQMELEGILNQYEFIKEDEKTVLHMLTEQLPETPLHFPDGRGSLCLRIPEWTAAQFISRLRVDKPLDARIAKAIDSQIPEAQRNGIRIKFRNSRFIQTENRILFFLAYFEKLKDSCEEGLDFMLALFEESDDNLDIYETLAERKRYCFQSVIKAVRYEQMLKKNNMETLFSQGVRVAYIDKQDAERKMEIIDRISRSIFGKTEYFQKPDEILEANEYRVMD